MRRRSTAPFRLLPSLIAAIALPLAGCGGGDAPGPGSGSGPGADPYAGEHAEQAAAPTNRIDIPDAVRRNLGVTFAKVESRNVARTLRVPGRFEALPTAHREYRAPLGGRVELLVEQYQRVEPGAPLFRIDAPTLRALEEEILATDAKVRSMPPLREAHRMHEKSLADKVGIWRERLLQLEALRDAGGGSAALTTEARAMLNATEAELADVMEKDAALEAEEARAQAELRALRARLAALRASSGCADSAAGSLVVCAIAGGVVESIEVTQGGLVEESGGILTVFQPELVRFRAHALQADLSRLRDGLEARVVAASADPRAPSSAAGDAMRGRLMVGVAADPGSRTIDLLVRPDSLAAWARAGVAGSLEVVLEGGREELAIPLSTVVRDGTKPVVFRRDPKNPDKAIRLEADLGVDDGRWIVIQSGVKEGDEVVLAGSYQLMLATSGSAPKGGHFHSDGTWHADDH